LKRWVHKDFPWQFDPDDPDDSDDPEWTFDEYPLHVACRNNAPITVIQALIQAWPGAVQAPADRLPLHEACSCGESLPIIKLLVEAWPESVQQRTTNVHGYLPLDLTLEKSEASFDIIQFLVQKWPESIGGSEDRLGALERALVHHQSYEIIHFLVQECPDIIKESNSGCFTPLHYACRYHHSPSTVRFLTQQCPAAVRIKADGQIPLMCALRSEYTPVETIVVLLDVWPESIKETASDDGETYLLLALHQDKLNVEIILLLIDRYPEAAQIHDKKYGELPLHLALNKRCDMDVIDLLVKSYPESVKVRDRHGNLPLYHVLWYNFDDCRLLVKLILESWPESIVQHGIVLDDSLPLREVLACNFQVSLAVINVLVKTKPDILRVQDVDGFSPLHLALHCPI